MQGCFYVSAEVLLFGHINSQRKPLFGNRKYNRGTLPSVGTIFKRSYVSREWAEASLLY